MKRTINEAISDEATRRYFDYKAPNPPDPPENITDQDWQSLSPGMRREIAREMERRPKIKIDLFDWR